MFDNRAEGISYKEIADVLSLSLDTVRMPACFPLYLHDYNFHRPHSALHHLPQALDSPPLRTTSQGTTVRHKCSDHGSSLSINRFDVITIRVE